MHLSVIIPTLNEVAEIEGAIRSARAAGAAEVLVVDGGSTDGTLTEARALGVRVFAGRAGRGVQIALGVAEARGDVLCVLHADTRLPPGAAEAIAEALTRPGVAGGAFDLRFREADPFLRILARGIGLRSRLGLPATGDQAQWFRRRALEAAGGIPETPLLEDVILWRRLARVGKLRQLSLVAETSGRRFLEGGRIRTLLGMWRIRFLHRLGWSPARLGPAYLRSGVRSRSGDSRA